MGAQNTEALGAKAHEEMLKKERRANNVWNKLKRNKTAMIGLVIVLFMVVIAIFAPVITSVDPDEIHPLGQCPPLRSGIPEPASFTQSASSTTAC